MLSSLAALLLALSAPGDTAWGEIRGTVVSEPTGVPLALAVVEAAPAGQALTDSSGAYVLRRVVPGRRTLRVHSMGHEPFEVEVTVPAHGLVIVDVALRHRPLALDTLSTLTPRGAVPTEPAPRTVSAITEITALEGPGGAGLDPSRASSGGGDVLLVRGSAADLKLVLLDGAPVYAPFHMGGLIESFDPRVLSGARLYLGGAPARYDGGVSYVLDLATRGAARERWSGDLGADMVSMRAEADGPLWKGAGLLLAMRGVHGGALGALEREPFPYAYADALSRLDVSLGGGFSLAVTGFANAEAVRVDSAADEGALQWGNAAASLRVRGRVLRADGEATVALSGFDARLPNASADVVVDQRQRRLRLAADFTRQLGALRLGYGYAYDRQWVRHLVLTDHGSSWFVRDTVAMVGGLYADALWPAGRQWVVRGGVRNDMYAQGSFMSLSPRLAVTWLPTSHAALTLAAGRYHQLVLRTPRRAPAISGVTLDFADTFAIATQPGVAAANHLTLSLDQELGEGVRLGLEGFWKRFESIPEAPDVDTYSSGVDVWVRRNEGVLSGWLGYSLGWYWSRADTSALSARFSGRQILTLGLAAQGRPGRAEVRVAYASGLPYSTVSTVGDGVPSLPPTLPPGGGSNGTDNPGDVSAPLSGTAPQDFLRIDAQVSRTFTPRVGGRETELTPYFRVLNALDRRDALFYRYSPTGDPHTRAVATLPLLPVLGLDWKL